MNCKSCGYKNSKEANFCEECGLDIRKSGLNMKVANTSVAFPPKGSESSLVVETTQKSRVSKKTIYAIVAVIAVVGIAWSASRDKSLSDEEIAASVVNVFCVPDESIDLEGEGYQGSGTIVDSSGVILTNAHLMPENYTDEEITCAVILPDPSTGAPKEIYYAAPLRAGLVSEYYDIAALEIYNVFTDEDSVVWGEYPRQFPAFDDTEVCAGNIKLGEPVRVFGYPSVSGSASLTVTEGVVSTILLEEGLILTSAKIDEGNSGGLAVDERGCMLGIPSAVSPGTYENLGVIILAAQIEKFVSAVESLDAGLLETLVESERSAREQAEAESAAARAAQQQAEAERTQEIYNSFLSQLTNAYNAVVDGIEYYNNGMSYYNSGSASSASNPFSQARAIFSKAYSDVETMRTGFTGLPYEYSNAAQNLSSAASKCINAADEMIYSIQYDYVGSANSYSESCFSYITSVRNFLTTKGL